MVFKDDASIWHTHYGTQISTKLIKKSFIVHTDEAYIGAYLFEGRWHASGVASTPQNWGNQVFLKAKKI